MTRVRSKLPPMPQPDEVWVVTRVNIAGVTPMASWVTPGKIIGMLIPISDSATPVLTLQGFHPSTKALLHTYGPFSPEELLLFAAEQGITLPDHVPSRPQS